MRKLDYDVASLVGVELLELAPGAAFHALDPHLAQPVVILAVEPYQNIIHVLSGNSFHTQKT